MKKIGLVLAGALVASAGLAADGGLYAEPMNVRRKEVLFDFKDGGGFVEVTLIEVEIADRVFCWAAGNEQDDNETIRWLEEHGREL